MIGGNAEIVEHLDPIFTALAQSQTRARLKAATCTAVRRGRDTSSRWSITALNMASWPRTPVISAALFERFQSRGNADYANRLLSAMRKQFGGHNERD
jgi:6-phosphogluconate dehydrogenase (decarboxylating)